MIPNIVFWWQALTAIGFCLPEDIALTPIATVSLSSVWTVDALASTVHRPRLQTFLAFFVSVSLTLSSYSQGSVLAIRGPPLEKKQQRVRKRSIPPGTAV